MQWRTWNRVWSKERRTVSQLIFNLTNYVTFADDSLSSWIWVGGRGCSLLFLQPSSIPTLTLNKCLTVRCQVPSSALAFSPPPAGAVSGRGLEEFVPWEDVTLNWCGQGASTEIYCRVAQLCQLDVKEAGPLFGKFSQKAFCWHSWVVQDFSSPEVNHKFQPFLQELPIPVDVNVAFLWVATQVCFLSSPQD